MPIPSPTRIATQTDAWFNVISVTPAASAPVAPIERSKLPLIRTIVMKTARIPTCVAWSKTLAVLIAER